MTGMLEHEMPGLGHNKPSDEDADEIKHGKWERWSKKRTFVRALEGTYSHLYKKLLEEPRVYSSKDHPWKGGPAMYGKHIISPQAVSVVQSIESHIECYAPLNAGQKHGHLNSAVFYVLKGHGHDVHDGRYMKWEAGDVMLVENGCVHQHFNDDEKESCILLVFKAKPLVPVHAPSVPEDGRVADRQAAARHQGIPSADGNLSAEGIMALFEDKQAALSGVKHQRHSSPRRWSSRKNSAPNTRRCRTSSRPRTCRGSARPTA